MIGKVLICLLLATVALAQTGTFNIAPSSVEFAQGLTSEYIFIEASENVQNGVTLSWTEVDVGGGTNNLNFVGGNSVTFDATHRSASFRVQSANNGSFSIEFTLSSNDQFITPASIGVFVNKRDITIEPLPTNVFVGQPSSPIQIWLEYPSGQDVTLTPSTSDFSGFLENGTITFNPATITIPAGSMSASFTYTAPGTTLTGNTYISWAVSGGEGFYVEGSTLSKEYALTTTRRQFTLPSFGISAEAVVGAHGNSWLYVYARQATNTSVTLTPQAADTTFSPSSITFTPGNNNVQRFSYVTTSPDSSKVVYWFLSQDSGVAYYAEPAPTTITVPKRQVFITAPSQYHLTNRTYFSVALAYPTFGSLTVSWYAAHLSFPVGSVTFEANKNTTSYSVAVDPKNLGSDQIIFRLSGEDADWYEEIDNVAVSVTGGSFTSPSSWYVPNLFIGQKSPKVLVRAAFAPAKSVTLTPSAPNLRFDPATLTFESGKDVQQYFQITPLYTNDITDTVSIVVNFLVSGEDHTYFTIPDPMTVTVNRRFIQNAWSAHLTNDKMRDPTTTANSRHLGKTYKVWSSINYIGDKESVTVTPVNPYFSFNPKVFKFDSKNTRVLFEATVTGVVGGTTIDYIIGGNEGGWYAPITANPVVTAVRPLAIAAAVLAPDTRLPHKKAGLVDYPEFKTNLLYSQWTVYSFKLRSSVLPDGGLTITPKCAHATFSPSSIKLGGDDDTRIAEYSPTHDISIPSRNFTWQFNNTDLYLEANFTVNPQAGGYHLVQFELSGKDADYYQRPADQYMLFNTVQRDSNEPKQSAAVVTLPSIALFVAVVCAMFL